MHHPTQLCVQMRARAPPPQRSQLREVREDPVGFLMNLFSGNFTPKAHASKSMLNTPSSEIPGKHQRRELRGFSMLQKPPVLVSNLVVCTRVFAAATFSTLSGPTGSATERSLAMPRSAAGHAEVHVPRWAREDLANQLAVAAGLCKVRPPGTPKRVIGRQRSHPTLSYSAVPAMTRG